MINGYVRLNQINDAYYCCECQSLKCECQSLKCELNKKIKHCNISVGNFLSEIISMYDYYSDYTYFHAYKDDDYMIITSLCNGIIDETIHPNHIFKIYFMNGKIHRIDGPAISILDKYYFRGMCLLKHEYDELIKNYKLYNNIIKELAY